MSDPNHDMLIGMTIVIVGPIVAGFFLFHSFRNPAKKFRRAYSGLQTSTAPVHGTVSIRFHTYDGFLAYFVQTPHEVYASPADARKLLGRLLRYNLTYGMFAAGCIFVPPLSLIEYLSQLRDIRRQEKFYAAAEAGLAPGRRTPHGPRTEVLAGTSDPQPGIVPGAANDRFRDLDDVPTPDAARLSKRYAMPPRLKRGRSCVRIVIGMIAAGLTFLFGTSIIVSHVQGDREAFFGGIFLTVFFGWLARYCLKSRRLDADEG
jgi:hypothetical protein